LENGCRRLAAIAGDALWLAPSAVAIAQDVLIDLVVDVEQRAIHRGRVRHRGRDDDVLLAAQPQMVGTKSQTADAT
jgi:hypothetical protein